MVKSYFFVVIRVLALGLEHFRLSAFVQTLSHTNSRKLDLGCEFMANFTKFSEAQMAAAPWNVHEDVLLAIGVRGVEDRALIVAFDDDEAAVKQVAKEALDVDMSKDMSRKFGKWHTEHVHKHHNSAGRKFSHREIGSGRGICDTIKSKITTFAKFGSSYPTVELPPTSLMSKVSTSRLGAKRAKSR